MADFPPFAFTTQESWYGELSFKAAEDGSPLSLAGRQFEMHITPATSGAQIVPPVLILTMETGRGLSLKQGDPSTLVFRVPKTTANDFPRTEFTGDVLEVVEGERYLFMPVRITYAEPSGLRSFLTRFLGVSVSFASRQQPIYTPLAVPGREGRPGATILRGTVPPVPADGKDDDYFIEDRTASGQGRRMWGPKAGGAWPGTPWNIQVAAISDVPGLPKAIEDSAQRAANLSDLDDVAAAREHLELAPIAKSADVADLRPSSLSEQSVARPYLARERDRPWTIPEFGSVGGENTDHTTLIQKALSSGELSIAIPRRTFNLEDAVACSVSGQRFCGDGTVSALRNRRPAGSPAVPMIIVPPGVTDCEIKGFAVRAAGQNKGNPSIGGDDGILNVPYGSAVVVCGDRTTVSDLHVFDAWDNGVSVIGVLYGAHPQPGVPSDVLISSVRTYNSGCGDHVAGGPGRIGSGINIISGSNFTVSDCIDRGSNGAVTVDDGGGASGRIIGCSGFLNPLNGNGVGASFYTGSNEVEFIGCQSYFSACRAFWLNGSSTITGGLAVGPAESAIHITGDNCTVTGLRAKNVGFEPNPSLLEPAVIRVDPIHYNILDLSVEGVRSWTSAGPPPKYGYIEVAGRGYSVDADVSAKVTGSVANFQTLGTSRAGAPRRIVKQQLSRTGYRIWSDGEIEQWGYVGESGDDQAVSFPTPFKEQVWDLQATMRGASSSPGTLETIATSTPTLTGFTGHPRFNNGTTTGHAGEPWTWRAHGR